MLKHLNIIRVSCDWPKCQVSDEFSGGSKLSQAKKQAESVGWRQDESGRHLCPAHGKRLPLSSMQHDWLQERLDEIRRLFLALLGGDRLNAQIRHYLQVEAADYQIRYPQDYPMFFDVTQQESELEIDAWCQLT